MKNFWIGVASLDHVEAGINGGFCQLCHGKQQPLLKMERGDWIVYYSPKAVFEGKMPLQKFTAIGQIVDETPYQCEMLPGFMPWRRNVAYVKHVTPISIHDVLNELEFIEDKKHYGAKFRFGHIKISEDDFMLIARRMAVDDKYFL